MTKPKCFEKPLRFISGFLLLITIAPIVTVYDKIQCKLGNHNYFWDGIESGDNYIITKWTCSHCGHEMKTTKHKDQPLRLHDLHTTSKNNLCDEHDLFPCKKCGTRHFDGCSCHFCKQ